ncbi:MAG TPA: hypothetical protein DDW65_03270 [Firmicutes bacterium]|jgi:hypothetical protein|nr:hypothetical protein [Bacillota bacterium]
MKGNLQVIVTDHAGGSAVKGVSHVNVIERWRKGRKLIPWHWSDIALKEYIDQNSKADAAIEDIVDSVLKPTILKELNLSDEEESYIVEIIESLFITEGIHFKVKIIGTSQDFIVEGIISPDLSLVIQSTERLTEN